MSTTIASMTIATTCAVAIFQSITYPKELPLFPKPIWHNFRGLFKHINRGNAALGIHAYNGGLFADDETL